MDVTRFDPVNDDIWGSLKPAQPSEAPVCPDLDTLIVELYKAFEEDHVDVDYVKRLFANYKSNPKDWKKFAKRDPHRYTRNLIDKGNGKFNLMLLCWNEAQGSSIHDHADAHCFMKVVEGELHEEQYSWPSPDNSDDAMRPTEINKFHTQDVAYINDTVGLHRVENKSHTQPACSIHLYIPAFGECNSFDQRSGKQQRCKVTFYSEHGKRTPFAQLTKRPAQSMEAADLKCSAQPSLEPGDLKGFGGLSIEDN